jgi:hypothetical protein
MTAVHVPSLPATDIGNGLASFDAWLQYTPLTATTGQLNLTIKNTTDPEDRGYITAIALGNPGGVVSNVQVQFIDNGMQLIGGPGFIGGIDCSNASTSWGNADFGFSCAGDWNTAGTLLTPGAGLRNGQSGTFQMLLTGTGMLALTEASFTGAKTSGSVPRFLPVHFRLLKDERSASGDDMLAAG